MLIIGDNLTELIEYVTGSFHVPIIFNCHVADHYFVTHFLMKLVHVSIIVIALPCLLNPTLCFSLSLSFLSLSSHVCILYSQKFWQGIAVLPSACATAKSKFLIIRLAIPYQKAKFKSAFYFAMVILILTAVYYCRLAPILYSYR